MLNGNKSDREGPCETTIVQSFEQQCSRTPEAVAVVCAGHSLTYRQLDDRSNQLARHLQRFGVQTETLVGVAVQRSVGMMVALLAILKAGGAYVPIDPGYPVQRTALMIEDSQSPVILATEFTRPRLPHTNTRILSIDGDADSIGRNTTDPIIAALDSRNLAYVIYTSGSTGKPKGVMIEHRNVINFFAGMDRVLGSGPGVWLALTSISFDISVLELFWTLSRGFQVIIHGDEGTQVIPAAIRNWGVTHLQCTPSLARMVAMDPEGLSSLGRLKKLLLGGEALPPLFVRQLRRVFHGEMFNMYGPTETTVWSTTFQIPEEVGSVPIGKPILNTQVYVLDSNLEPVAVGESGKLFIGGDGIARGYWRRSELTAERFLADPFRPGNRIYHTGDIARFLPDGNLEFLGRADFQIKLRGFRIEVGEIEAALESQEGIGQAVVVARDFKPEDKRLVAYLVSKDRFRPSIASLRSALSSTLPDYMVPANFVFLDSLPLTANGKIDRSALPTASASEDHLSDKALEQPGTELESLIAQVWKDALGVDQVGVNENFIDLGAHSLMVAEVHAQLEQLLGREISLVDLFQFPTVLALANHLGGKERPQSASSRAERRRAAQRRRAR